MQPLLDDYLTGIDALPRAITGLTPTQLRARPIPGKWSTLEVLCHLCDSEMIFAERMKRILIEDQPPLRFFDPDRCVAALAYHDRDADEEIALLAATRRQMARILQSQPPDSWLRVGIHSQDGPKTLESIVRKAVDHLQHHLATIEAKRRLL